MLDNSVDDAVNVLQKVHPHVGVVLHAGPLQEWNVLLAFLQDPGPHMWGDGEDTFIILGLPLVPELAFIPHVHATEGENNEECI